MLRHRTGFPWLAGTRATVTRERPEDCEHVLTVTRHTTTVNARVRGFGEFGEFGGFGGFGGFGEFGGFGGSGGFGGFGGFGEFGALSFDSGKVTPSQ